MNFCKNETEICLSVTSLRLTCLVFLTHTAQRHPRILLRLSEPAKVCTAISLGCPLECKVSQNQTSTGCPKLVFTGSVLDHPAVQQKSVLNPHQTFTDQNSTSNGSLLDISRIINASTLDIRNASTLDYVVVDYCTLFGS